MEKEISDLMRENLRKFPLFEETHKIGVREIGKYEEKLWIGYRTKDGNPIGTTHFDLNIIGNTCYVLYVYLARENRGADLGKSLYNIIENFAREFGCDRVRLTPSGWTPSGKTRLEYMKSLGYHEIGREVEKILS